MTTDFNTLLKKPVGTAEPPPRAPAGDYILRQKNFKFGKSRFDQNIDCVEFFYGVEGPADPGAFGDQLDGVKLHAITLSKSFDITDEALIYLQSYLESCEAITPGNPEGIGFDQAIAQNTNGKLFLAEVTLTPSKNNAGQFFNNVKKIGGYKQD